MTMLDASAFDERRARLSAIRAGWYGDASAVSPHGRRIYKDGTVEHLTTHHESRQSPPDHEMGRAYLRALLRDWRTEHALLAEWDVENGGALRRCLVAAGVALRDETADGRERAEYLVRQATMSASASAVPKLNGIMARLAGMPVGPWRIGGGLAYV